MNAPDIYSTRAARTADRIAALDIDAAVSAHTPALRRKQVADAIAMMRQLPDTTPPPVPGQVEFEAMLAQMAGHA